MRRRDFMLQTSSTEFPCAPRYTSCRRTATSTSCMSTCAQQSDSGQGRSLRLIRSRHENQQRTTVRRGKGGPHVERLPQTEQNRRGAAVVDGPTAAVRYEGTSGGSAARFACPTPRQCHNDAATRELSCSWQTHRRAHLLYHNKQQHEGLL